ncbi:hypothetical protein O181_114410 [Austropuccinia psidii MF-1]|uniref:Uncharacterized protein n=1 Tax=Austropuccinia psidii MF-1 TaxID=1389203 RepID=A0A9Q3K4D7_9BASI|nr:hypothetical protein [Austropuccinia psidii MF-1]
MISPVPLSISFSTTPPRPPSNSKFNRKPKRIYYPANEGWQWQEEIQTWAGCHHTLSPMGFKCQSKFSFLSLTNFSSCNQANSSSSLIEQNPPNLP